MEWIDQNLYKAQEDITEQSLEVVTNSANKAERS